MSADEGREAREEVATPGQSDLPIREILRRIEAAEALLCEARSLLGGTEVASEAASTTTAASTAATAPVQSGEGPRPEDDGWLDPVILARYAPPGPEESYRSAIVALFRMAIDPPPAGDLHREIFARLLHPQARPTLHAMQQILRFPWQRFMKHHPSYLARADDPASFHVVRTRPEEPSGATKLKVFLEARGRSPAPIDVERDPASGGAWRVVAFSL